MIDWTRVAQLHDEIGDAGFSEILEVFLEEMEGIVAPLCGTPDPAQLEMTLHAMRGGLLNLGFTDTTTLCREGEALAAQGHADRIDTALIVQSYDAACRVFLSEVAQRMGSAVSAR